MFKSAILTVPFFFLAMSVTPANAACNGPSCCKKAPASVNGFYMPKTAGAMVSGKCCPNWVKLEPPSAKSGFNPKCAKKRSPHASAMFACKRYHNCKNESCLSKNCYGGKYWSNRNKRKKKPKIRAEFTKKKNTQMKQRANTPSKKVKLP